jgi:hypothetical protein
VSAALLLAWWMAAPARLLELRSESVEGRPAVVVVASAPLGDVSVRRDGPDVVVSLAATAPEPLAAPPVAAPLQALRLERTPGGVQLRIRVAPEVTYEIRRELNRLVLLFGLAAAATPPASPDLYRGLFPPPAGGSEPLGVAPAGGSPDVPVPERPPEPKREGLHVGALIVKPSATLSYVDADVSLLDTPQAVRDHYAEARPALGVEIPLRDGALRLDYEARIRAYSAFESVNGVTHLGNAHLQYPLGLAVTLRGTGHFTRGLLETTEVDPGGEYFFSLGRFTRRQVGAGARLKAGSRIDLDLAGSLDRVTIDAASGFFDYERRTASGGLGVELGLDRRGSLVYSFEQVPASPERPESESRIHSVSGTVEGEILPLLSGRASVGYTRRRSPRAAPEGQRFRGLTFGAQLKRDFGRSTNIVASANRSTELSAFERNAFYVTTSVQGVLTAPLPLSFFFSAGGGYHVNRYPTVAAQLGAPRRDQIVGWVVGLGRGVTRWAFVRADYRRDRRDSNIDFFDQRTHALYVQLGLGFFGEASHR